MIDFFHKNRTSYIFGYSYYICILSFSPSLTIATAFLQLFFSSLATTGQSGSIEQTNSLIELSYLQNRLYCSRMPYGAVLCIFMPTAFAFTNQISTSITLTLRLDRYINLQPDMQLSIRQYLYDPSSFLLSHLHPVQPSFYRREETACLPCVPKYDLRL